ncbi:MAG: tetrahydromethanopterin S-methyltransferase subunit H [Methanosarcinales archaeon]|nr:tetrahydromethanopterin S-methyltransferase subunit H [Methanosarcinales archaeon]
MFVFQKEQQIVNIANIKIGGQPGELPTVLAGTIFYNKHHIVSDPAQGIFDKKEAEKLINTQQVQADETGNPHMVHIYAESEDAARKYMDFVSAETDAPFLIDSTDSKVRMAAAGYVSEVGLADKTIYNSMNMSITDEELNALGQSDVDSAIILGFNAIDSSLDGRMELLESGSSVLPRGLLEMAEDCGITKKLIDPGITPMGNGAGVALRMNIAAKAKWGFPVGSGIHNAPSAWNWLRSKRKEDKLVYKICDIASTGLQQMAAGDFVLYGPIEYAKYTFPLAAMSDIMISESVADLDVEPVDGHPIWKLV